jgi:uncharacterized membrane protein SpoIIM required for sporulation
MTVKTRTLSFGVFVGVFLLAYTIGTGYKMSNEESQSFLKDFEGATKGIDAFGIFLHNTSVALPMFIPAFGVCWGSFTGWQTGAAFNAIASSDASLSNIPPLFIFLASPFGILELGAYSIGMSRSFLLVWRIVKKKPIKKEIIPLVVEIGVVIVILFIGGFIESSMMTQHVSLSS